MPQKKRVDPLFSLCADVLANYFHNLFKDFSDKKAKTGQPPTRLTVCRTRRRCHQLLTCVPSSVQLDLFNRLEDIVKAEKSLLDEDYYRCLGIFLNEKTRHLVLSSPRLFQDSSLALESFLSEGLTTSTSLRELSLCRAVTDLACFEFAPILETVAEMRELRSLTLQGLNQVEIDEDAMLNFLKKLSKNCSKLQHLDLTDSSLDNRCCDELATLTELRCLRLDHCRVETAGAATIMATLKKLLQFDCDAKLQTLARMQGATNFGDVKLRSATFRHLRGLREVSLLWPQLESVRIVYKDYELGTSAISLDDGLRVIAEFAEKARVELELHGMNLLIPIQMTGLSLYGPRIRRLSLTQGEFLHPQSLNPWSRWCPNLASLEVIGCGAISDEMFVGDIPQLDAVSFPALEDLHFEGDFPLQIARFMLKDCLGLTRLTLRVAKGFSSGILRMLTSPPRDSLKEVQFEVDRIESDFVQILHKVIEDSGSLSRLELLCFDKSLHSDLEEIDRCIRNSNWDLKFLYHIKRRPRNLNS